MSGKNEKKDNITGSLTDMMNNIYLFFMLGYFPIITHDKYFDITKTKCKFFLYVTLFYFIFMITGYYIEKYMKKGKGKEKRETGEVKTEPLWRLPKKWIFWLEAFLLSNIFAWFMSRDPAKLSTWFRTKGEVSLDAWTGDKGRFMGLMMYLVLCGMVFLLSCRLKPDMSILLIFALSTGYVYFFALLQHFGIDHRGFLEKIASDQKKIFVSTLGNINIFASFVVISTAVFLCLFLFEEQNLYRIVGAILSILSGAMLVIANSDSAYLGLFAILFVTFFFSYKEEKMQRFFLGLTLLAIGNLGIALLHRFVITEYYSRGGVAEFISSPFFASVLLLAVVFLYGCVRFAAHRFGMELDALDKNKVICGILIAMGVFAVVGVFVGIRLDLGIFHFDYKWGTYRGYIWTKCGETFWNAPMVNKLFGFGNESIREVISGPFHDEMLRVTNRVYDNAHNELLQYLITTGLLGALSYVGLFVSSFIYILKRAKGFPMAYICLTVMAGYFVQGLINLNQPITTPFYFLFLAMGLGAVRHQEMLEE